VVPEVLVGGTAPGLLPGPGFVLMPVFVPVGGGVVLGEVVVPGVVVVVPGAVVVVPGEEVVVSGVAVPVAPGFSGVVVPVPVCPVPVVPV
jgi:hypothetical protein